MIDKNIIQAAVEHANAENPKESCGLVIKVDGQQQYMPCRNVSADPNNNFQIHQEDWCRAEDAGEVVAIVHSHPGESARPSQADKFQAEIHGLPWLIIGHNGHEVYQPSGYKVPLLGRDFHHGILDCYQAVRDWYSRECGLTLRDYQRSDCWWEAKEAKSLYVEQFALEGFTEVSLDEIQRGDALLMRVGRTHHINHAAIYLGDDPSIKSEDAPRLYGQGPFFYHHLYGRNSTREILGDSWLRRTEKVLRHKSFL